VLIAISKLPAHKLCHLGYSVIIMDNCVLVYGREREGERERERS
jgi:hypothetical protein